VIMRRWGGDYAWTTSVLHRVNNIFINQLVRSEIITPKKSKTDVGATPSYKKGGAIMRQPKDIPNGIQYHLIV
jgi:hypothetical protein